MHSEPVYNPLDKHNLSVSVADALLAKAPGALPPEDPFIGAGVYAIYYRGNFPAYRSISLDSKPQRETPIYVGKAVPAGARKGRLGLDVSHGTALFTPLAQHADSIRQVGNLNLADFLCRYLVVDDIWIPLGESLLVQNFSPLWNQLIDGFGNHDPGKSRHQGRMPSWDVLHPGRNWATRLQPNKQSSEELLARIT